MSDQERLENIKKHHEYTIKKPFFTTTAHPTDVAWLIKRVQELEDKLQDSKDENSHLVKIWDKKWSRLNTENQRYKQALEFYADEENYDMDISFLPALSVDCMIFDDNGHAARQALKGESS